MAVGSELGVTHGNQLEGRVALITGAASGQGRAAALLFAEHGAAVVVVDVNDDGANETVACIDRAGGDATAVHADVSLRRDCDTMVAAAVETYGRLDVLYNNAAVQMSGRLVDTTEQMWDLTLATNLSSIFWACRAAIPCMLAGGGGTIVNTSSTLGQSGSEGYAAYGAAKAGLIALTRQIAVEYGPRVHRECDRAGIDRHAALPYRHDPHVRRGRVSCHARTDDPDASPRARRRRRPARVVLGLRRVGVHHRCRHPV